MKYIDAEKLKRAIYSLYDNMLKRAKLDSENANYWNGKADAYRVIYDHIDSLQHIASLQQEQPEADLEKEIDKYFDLWRQGASDEGCVNANSQFVSIYDCYRIARHFYELGLNARKK